MILSFKHKILFREVREFDVKNNKLTISAAFGYSIIVWWIRQYCIFCSLLGNLCACVTLLCYILLNDVAKCKPILQALISCILKVQNPSGVHPIRVNFRNIPIRFRNKSTAQWNYNFLLSLPLSSIVYTTTDNFYPKTNTWTQKR